METVIPTTIVLILSQVLEMIALTHVLVFRQQTMEILPRLPVQTLQGQYMTENLINMYQ